MGTQLIKFRHNDKVGLFHYTIFEGDFVALSEKILVKLIILKRAAR